jgi:FAD-dependent urate hydroxylase
MTKFETIVIGAGPYGLSIAAHLRSANLDHAVVGSPMESWRVNMPDGMALKSERFASNLSDPEGLYTLERFCARRGTSYSPKGVPLPIEDFIDYADWFQRQAVPDVWNTRLRRLRRTASGFELALDDCTVTARRVILATGHLAFRRFPEALQRLAQDAPGLVSHAADHRDLAKFAGRSVTVIGGGQSGLETAALLHENGADVRVLARAPAIAWNADFDATTSLYKRLRWPDSGLGDGWRSLAYSELPRLFVLLPENVRRRIVATANGPAGSWWLKTRLIGKVPLLTDHHVVAAAERNGKLNLSVRRGDDFTQVETDHAIAGTGYQVNVDRLPFLDAALRAAIVTSGGSPVLKGAFESSVPGLHFVGLSSALTFGPVMRFVFGARHAAVALTKHIRPTARQRFKLPSVSARSDGKELNPIGLADPRS